jgi:hypothetical protein
MNTVGDFDNDDRLAAHLRRTLHTVADTVTGGSVDRATVRAAETPVRHRSGRRLAVALAAITALAGLGVAWNQLDEGEIVRIPTEAALLAGSTEEGGDWWLIPSANVHPSQEPPRCDPPPASVVFVSEASNRAGQEWNAGGVVYGEPPAPPDICHDEDAWLASPARFGMGSSRLGPSDDGGDEETAWGYYAAFHPTVTRVLVTADGHAPFAVDTVPLPKRPDGPRFAAFTTPSDTLEVTIELFTADGTRVLEWTSKRGG